MRKSVFYLVLLVCLSQIGLAQDTLYLKNGDVIIGELKSLDKAVISFETDYSDSDFKIEWKGVEKISTSTIFLITTSNGLRLSGYIAKGDSLNFYIMDNGRIVKVPADDIVHLKSINEGFWSNFNAHVDVGFNITKAKNLRQLTVNSGFGYLGEKWAWNVAYNSLNARQDSVSPTLRRDASINVNRFLQHDIFATVTADYLSNTEQLLDLRLNGRAGLGYYMVHSNRWYWNAAAGISYVEEVFTSGEGDKQSMEAFISTELNLFDFGDLSFYTKIVAYPGITEAGRFRSDINANFKYDLPFDFYLKSGITINYDSQPTVGASETDYVFNTGFGWEW